MDGGSTDGTLEVLHSLAGPNVKLTSEADDGIYDALNKGMQRASGDVIGLMHSDDFFASSHVLTHWSRRPLKTRRQTPSMAICNMSRRQTLIALSGTGPPATTRLQGSARGWMPPHPTLYVRRSVIDRWGGYHDREFSSCAGQSRR